MRFCVCKKCARLSGPVRRRPPGDCRVWRRTGRSLGRHDRYMTVGRPRGPTGRRRSCHVSSIMACRDMYRIVLLVVLSCETALGQHQQAFGANGMPEPPSLTQTALNVFDKDHNGKVTLKEVSPEL